MSSRSIKNASQVTEAYTIKMLEEQIPKTSFALEVRDSGGKKGKGLYTLEVIPKNSFVIEYLGERLTIKEGIAREAKYEEEKQYASYMFFVSSGPKGVVIDAQEPLPMYGNARYINHNANGNLKKILIKDNKGKLHVCFIAKEEILWGEELTFAYGENRKIALKANEWLKQEKNSTKKTKKKTPQEEENARLKTLASLSDEYFGTVVYYISEILAKKNNDDVYRETPFDKGIISKFKGSIIDIILGERPNNNLKKINTFWKNTTALGTCFDAIWKTIIENESSVNSKKLTVLSDDESQPISNSKSSEFVYIVRYNIPTLSKGSEKHLGGKAKEIMNVESRKDNDSETESEPENKAFSDEEEEEEESSVSITRIARKNNNFTDSNNSNSSRIITTKHFGLGSLLDDDNDLDEIDLTFPSNNNNNNNNMDVDEELIQIKKAKDNAELKIQEKECIGFFIVLFLQDWEMLIFTSLKSLSNDNIKHITTLFENITNHEEFFEEAKNLVNKVLPDAFLKDRETFTVLVSSLLINPNDVLLLNEDVFTLKRNFVVENMFKDVFVIVTNLQELSTVQLILQVCKNGRFQNSKPLLYAALIDFMNKLKITERQRFGTTQQEYVDEALRVLHFYGDNAALVLLGDKGEIVLMKLIQFNKRIRETVSERPKSVIETNNNMNIETNNKKNKRIENVEDNRDSIDRLTDEDQEDAFTEVFDDEFQNVKQTTKKHKKGLAGINMRMRKMYLQKMKNKCIAN